MIQLARATLSRINLALAAAAGVLIVVVALLGCYEAAARYLFNKPTTWATDLSGFLLVYIVFLGLPLTLQDGQHVSVELFVDLLRGRLRTIAITVGSALTLVYLGIFGWFVSKHTLAAFQQDWLSVSLLAIPLKWVFVVGPVCALLFLLTAMLMSVDTWRDERRSGAGVDPPPVHGDDGDAGGAARR